MVLGIPFLQGEIDPLETGIIYEQEIQLYLNKLDTNKFTGSVNSSPRLLKESANSNAAKQRLKSTSNEQDSLELRVRKRNPDKKDK